MADAIESGEELAPWLEQEIARAVAPFADKVTASELAWMKAQLRSSAASGAASRFANDAAPRRVVMSGAITRDETNAPRPSEKPEGTRGR